MIIWLASYPKSGNTLVRSLLASYIFSKDGNFNFELLKNIKQFPDNSLFKQIGVDTNNEEEMYKNYINSQKIFYNKDSIRFLKTHSCFVNKEGFRFTDGHNTLGVIYIVRDPRNIVTSFSHHFQQTPKQSLESLLSHQYLGKTSEKHALTYLGSWKYHYNSWKVFENYNRYLLIRYEDLISDTEQTFLKILKFIYSLRNINFSIDTNKLKNVIETTSLDNLKKLEQKDTFSESAKDSSGNKINFFDKGGKRNWSKELSEDMKVQLEKALNKEMIELGYL